VIIDGKKIANDIQAEIRNTILLFSGRKPCLAVILVGNHLASEIYVKRKTQACESVGILVIIKRMPSTIQINDLLAEITALNEDPSVDGILVQLPLPAHINPMPIIHAIQPDKDIDGFHPLNVGKMLIGETGGFIPCTPLGIQFLLSRSSIEMTGKHVVILGRSNIVGKPLAALLMQNTPDGNATVTVAHRHSTNLKELCLLADILIVAIGQPKFITANMVRDGAIIIDVGINKIDNPTQIQGYQIVGDVDFINVEPKCSYITPVPGGVGPMTIAMLLRNTLISYQNRLQLNKT